MSTVQIQIHHDDSEELRTVEIDDARLASDFNGDIVAYIQDTGDVQFDWRLCPTKYPWTELTDLPPLHWYNVFSDLLAIESSEDTADNFHRGKYVTAYVECFTREDGYYHWQVHKGDETSHGWMETLEEAQRDAETQFDLVRNA